MKITTIGTHTIIHLPNRMKQIYYDKNKMLQVWYKGNMKIQSLSDTHLMKTIVTVRKFIKNTIHG